MSNTPLEERLRKAFQDRLERHRTVTRLMPLDMPSFYPFLSYLERLKARFADALNAREGVVTFRVYDARHAQCPTREARYVDLRLTSEGLDVCVHLAPDTSAENVARNAEQFGWSVADVAHKLLDRPQEVRVSWHELAAALAWLGYQVRLSPPAVPPPSAPQSTP